jgi:hypothetical protein
MKVWVLQPVLVEAGLDQRAFCKEMTGTRLVQAPDITKEERLPANNPMAMFSVAGDDAEYVLYSKHHAAHGNTCVDQVTGRFFGLKKTPEARLMGTAMHSSQEHQTSGYTAPAADPEVPSSATRHLGQGPAGKRGAPPFGSVP